MIKHITATIIIVVSIHAGISAQQPWTVHDTLANEISRFYFDDDFALEGAIIYENACMSCHGTPTKENYSVMSPMPGDPASEQFANQKDGALFHKIKTGRGGMPAYGDILLDEEIWSVISYFRTYHKNYLQESPYPEGTIIPVYNLDISFDNNVDKLVVKVFQDDLIPVENATVSAFITAMFGKMSLGTNLTNEHGIAWFNVDTKIPGDSLGNLTFQVKAHKGYGRVSSFKTLQAVQPAVKVSAVKGRHLWSAGNKAPIWLIVTFFGTLASIWIVLFFILFGLRKIPKA